MERKYYQDIIRSLTREQHKDYIDGFLSGAMGKVLKEKKPNLFKRCQEAEKCAILFSTEETGYGIHTANGKSFVIRPEFVNDFENDDYNNAYYDVTVLTEA